MRDRLAPRSDLERAFWRILRLWNCEGPDGWRTILNTQLLPGEMKPRVESLFNRFTTTAVFREIGHEKHLDLEFTLDPQLAFPELGGQCQGPVTRWPLLQGTIDLLFQTQAGWHLYALELGTEPEARSWDERKPWLAVQAWACAKRFGVEPVFVGQLNLETGAMTGEPGKDLQFELARETVVKALSREMGRASPPHDS